MSERSERIMSTVSYPARSAGGSLVHPEGVHQ
jgi:hypothetical protein